MTFFYDLNKKLADLAKKQELTESSQSAVAEASTGDYSAKKARAGKDIGKPGKMFSKIAKSAGERYGSKERGEKVAGAVLAKLRKTNETDMEEGNKFTGNLMKARAAGLKKADLDGDGDMETVREADVVGLEEKKAKPDYIDLDKDGNKKEPMKKAAKDAKKSKGTAFDPEVAKGMFAHKDDSSRFDVKDTGYSKRYTRKPEPEADEPEVSDQPKKKGRPKGPAKGPERTTKGAWKHKGERKIKEADSVALTDKGEYDQEGDMAKDQLHTMVKAAKELHSILADEQNLPEWVQSKITKALDYIKAANDYMDQEKHDSDNMEPIAEKAVSQQQQKFMGMVHAMQKGEKIKGASKELKKAAKEMPKKAAKDYAATKHAGLPKKVKEESAEEPKAAKSSGGFQFGKGVYESLDSQFKAVLNEGMNISVNMNTGPDGNPTKNITVSADGDDAESLAALLKMAGIGGGDVCPSCGKAGCGCEELDENSPDWPTNTEEIEADPNLRTYSGGLNGPKSTGQTTVPVIASQLRRQVSMEESVELERSLFKLYKQFEAK
jgi:hypothetical protein